jgi:hypothetical protein
MQDRINQIDKTSCIARPDHTVGSEAEVLTDQKHSNDRSQRSRQRLKCGPEANQTITEGNLPTAGHRCVERSPNSAMIREIELIVSDRLPIDLAARGLKPDQIAKIMEWLSAQTRRAMDRSEVEAELRTMGFSQAAVDGIVVSLVKESVRPHLGKYVVVSLLVLMLGLFAILALFRWVLDRTSNL